MRARPLLVRSVVALAIGGAGMLVLSLAAPASTGAAAPGAAALSVVPVRGHPQQHVTATVTGLSPGQRVGLEFGRTVVRHGQAGSSGQLSMTFAVPASAVPGRHPVRVVDSAGTVLADKRFLVRTNWASSGFDPHDNGANPWENVLNASNVTQLHQVWHAVGTFPGDNAMYAPSVANGLVFASDNYKNTCQCGGSESSLWAFDASTGAVVWDQGLLNSVIGVPAYYQGAVYAVEDGDILDVFDAATGQRLWGWGPQQAAETPWAPEIAGGTVFVTSRDSVWAVDIATHNPIWQTSVNGLGSPAYDNGDVFVQTTTGVDALDATTGQVLWSTPLNVFSGTDTGVTVGDGHVFANGNNGQFYALDESTGAVGWTFQAADSSSFINTPADANGVVYAESEDADLYALDDVTGQKNWSVQASGGGCYDCPSPSIANGYIYVAGGALDIIDASNGSVLASYQGVGGNGNPAIANGNVYLSSDGGLYDYGPS